MTQQLYDAEAALTFLTSLVMTIRRIEQGQPEPGFREVFMDLLDKHLEGGVLRDEAEGLVTRERVQEIRRTLGDLFYSGDIMDATKQDQ